MTGTPSTPHGTTGDVKPDPACDLAPSPRLLPTDPSSPSVATAHWMPSPAVAPRRRVISQSSTHSVAKRSRSGTVGSHHSLSLSLAASASAYVTSAASAAPSMGNYPSDPLLSVEEAITEESPGQMEDASVPELPSDKHLPWSQRRSTIASLVGFSLFVDMVVYGAVVPILPYIAAEKLHVDEASLGFLFASYALGLLLSTPPIAYLSDKLRNRKWPMFFGLAGLVFTTIIFALSTQYWQLLLARILQGFSAGAPWTVGLSLLADVYPPEHLGSVIGPVLSCNHAGFLAGPVIGGWLFQYFGYAAPFYFSAGLAFLNLLFRLIVDESRYLNASHESEESPLLRGSGNSSATLTDLVVDYNSTTPAVIVTSPPSDNTLSTTASERSSTSTGAQQQQGMLSLLRGLPIQLCILVTVVVGGIFSGLEPTLPLHLHEEYHLTPSQIGSTFVSLVIPSMVTATIAGNLSDRIGGFKVLLLGLVLLALTATLPALPGLPLWGEIVALVMFGGAQSFAMTPIVPIMGRYVSSKGSTAFASVYALFNLAYSVAILFGPSIAGVVFSQFGFFWLMASSAMLLGLLIVPVVVVAKYAGLE